ncbi:MAG: hypothetical protein IKX23_04115 [Treponema sp.]|nr:hypothetical protein [Treponema sp.]
MKQFKKSLSIVLFTMLLSFLGAQTYSSQQMLPPGHWIYDSLFTLEMENSTASFLDEAPLPISELKLYFSKIDYEKLSDSGKALYKKVEEFFEKKNFTLELFKPVKLGFNLITDPVLMYKSNDEIPWSFSNDYTGHKTTHYYKDDNGTPDDSSDDIVKKEKVDSVYVSSSSYEWNPLTRKILTAPLYLDFGDYAIIETDLCLGKNIIAMSRNDNWTNLIYKKNDFDFLWPTYAYFSTGYLFNNGLGINLHVGREGLEMGKTLTGSIVYNKTFQTDAFVQLNLYSPKFKYSMDVIEINNKKNLYLHNLEFIPFKWIKLSVTEGTMINGPFELRYLNPLMIMHSYGSWNQYNNDTEEQYYHEGHCCAYFGVRFDIIPVKNLRIYGLYAMTEAQPKAELHGPYGRRLPDGIGFQGGIDYKLPVKSGGYLDFAIEGVYTTPYLYVKQSGDWSLYSERHNMLTGFATPICSWIGSPFGPDCAAGKIKVSYNNNNKWSIDLSYLFAAHGENNFGMFSQKTKVDSDGDGIDDFDISSHYPSALYELGLIDQEEAEKLARSWALTGTIQYTNQISLGGKYQINKNCSLDANLTYSFIFNNKNVEDNFGQGFQAGIAFEYRLFE